MKSSRTCLLWNQSVAHGVRLFLQALFATTLFVLFCESEDALIIRLLRGNQMEQDPRQLVRSGGDGFGCAQATAETAIETPQIRQAAVQGVRCQPQRLVNAILGAAGLAGKNAVPALAGIGTQPQPGTERRRIGKLGYVGPDLGQNGIRGERTDARNGRQINPKESVQFAAQIETDLVLPRLVFVTLWR